jgi:hypothetical protein
MFTAMKGSSARGDWAWISRATTSFPDPLSPVMSTVVSARAIFSIARRKARAASLSPMKRVPGAAVLAPASIWSSRFLFDHGRLELMDELVGVEGLDEVVDGAGLERLDRVVYLPEGRDHDHGTPETFVPDLLEELLSPHHRHLEVRHHGVEGLRLHELEGFPSIGGRRRFDAF